MWGIKQKKIYKIADIPELEKAYRMSKTLPHETIKVSYIFKLNTLINKNDKKILEMNDKLFCKL